MESIKKLNEAVKNVIEITDKINGDINAFVYNQAPVIIHQRLCSELLNVMKLEPNKPSSGMPKAMEILTSINILEELYPILKD